MDRVQAIRDLLEDQDIVAVIEAMPQGKIEIDIGTSEVAVVVIGRMRRRRKDIDRVPSERVVRLN